MENDKDFEKSFNYIVELLVSKTEKEILDGEFDESYVENLLFPNLNNKMHIEFSKLIIFFGKNKELYPDDILVKRYKCLLRFFSDLYVDDFENLSMSNTCEPYAL